MFKIKTKISGASVIALTLILIIFFYGLSVRPSGRLSWHQQIVVAILTPFQKSFVFIGRGVEDIWNHYFDLVGVSKESEKFKEIIARQKYELNKMQELESENNRLRNLLGFREKYLLTAVGAEVVANDPRADFRVVTVNKGSSDKIAANMPVVAVSGLVGRVADTSNSTSRVLLITDPNNAVDVVVQRSRSRALLVGTIKGTELSRNYYLSRLEYLDRKSDIIEGDVLITSGLDGIYPSGIPVGVVAALDNDSYGVFKDAEVVPFVDFSSLEEVLIVSE